MKHLLLFIILAIAIGCKGTPPKKEVYTLTYRVDSNANVIQIIYMDSSGILRATGVVASRDSLPWEYRFGWADSTIYHLDARVIGGNPIDNSLAVSAQVYNGSFCVDSISGRSVFLRDTLYQKIY